MEDRSYNNTTVMTRPLLLSLCLWLLLIGSARAQDAATEYTRALGLIVGPDKETMDLVQRVVDEGWTGATPARPLDELLRRNEPALDALQRAADCPDCDFRGGGLVGSRVQLSAFRLVLALAIVRGERGLPAAGRDARTLLSVGRHLLGSRATGLRIIGAAAISRGSALAGRVEGSDRGALGAWLQTYALAPPSEVVQGEKTRYLDMAADAARTDASLAPHAQRAALALAADFYDPLLRPLAPAEAEALQSRFEALYTKLGNRYGQMDPRKVTELIPLPAPPPQQLGEAMAGLVLCSAWPDARMLVKRYAEALKKLDEARRRLVTPRA